MGFLDDAILEPIDGQLNVSGKKSFLDDAVLDVSSNTPAIDKKKSFTENIDSFVTGDDIPGTRRDMSIKEKFEDMLGIKSFEQQGREQKDISSSLQDRGMNKYAAEGLSVVGPAVEDTLDFAQFMTPSGIIKGAVTVAGLVGAKSVLDGYLKGDDAQEISRDAVKESAIAGGIDVAGGAILGRGINVVRKGASKIPGVGSLADKGRKVLRSNEIIKNIKSKIGDLNKSTEKAVRELDGKILDLEEGKEIVKKPIVSYSETAAKDSIIMATSELDKNINTSLKRISADLNNTTSKIVKGFNTKYDEVLKGDTGNIPVDINTQIDDIANALNIKSTKPKEKIRNIYNALTGDLSKKGARDIGSLDFGTGEIPFKDVHWLKQALNDYARTMENASSTQGMAGVIKGIAKNLDTRLDKISPKYGAINNEYRKFKNMSDIFQSAFGKEFKTSVDEPVRITADKIKSSVRKVVDDGLPLTDDLVKNQMKPILAIREKQAILRNNGFSKEADRIGEQLDNIYNTFTSKKNITTSLEKLNKEKMLGDKVEATRYTTEINKISDEIGKIKQAKKRIQLEQRYRKSVLIKRTEPAVETLKQAGINKEDEIKALSSLGSDILRGFPTARKTLPILTLITEAKQIGLVSAAKFNNLLNTLQKSTEKLSKRTRKPINFLIQQARNISKSEEQ